MTEADAWNCFSPVSSSSYKLFDASLKTFSLTPRVVPDLHHVCTTSAPLTSRALHAETRGTASHKRRSPLKNARRAVRARENCRVIRGARARTLAVLAYPYRLRADINRHTIDVPYSIIRPLLLSRPEFIIVNDKPNAKTHRVNDSRTWQCAPRTPRHAHVKSSVIILLFACGTSDIVHLTRCFQTIYFTYFSWLIISF